MRAQAEPLPVVDRRHTMCGLTDLLSYMSPASLPIVPVCLLTWTTHHPDLSTYACQNKTVGTGLSEEDCQNRSVKTRQKMTVRTKLSPLVRPLQAIRAGTSASNCPRTTQRMSGLPT